MAKKQLLRSNALASYFKAALPLTPKERRLIKLLRKLPPKSIPKLEAFARTMLK